MAAALSERDPRTPTPAERELLAGVGRVLLQALERVPPCPPHHPAADREESALVRRTARQLLTRGGTMPASARTDGTLARFRTDRNAALRSLDEAQLLAFCRRYGVPMPADRSPDGPFWAGAHKARTECTDLTPAERLVSRRWLAERGYTPSVGRR